MNIVLVFPLLFSLCFSVHAMNVSVAINKNDKIINEIKILNVQDIEKNHASNIPLLISAAFHNHVQAARLLLSQGEDINTKEGRTANTPLITACKQGHDQFVKLLLDSGADINIKNQGGDTALMFAAARGHFHIVQLLLDKGVDINTKNNIENTALMYAIGKGHIQVVELLLDKGADINAIGKTGLTAFMVAAANGHEHIAQLLFDRGVDINAKDNIANTALMYAIGHGHVHIAELLLDKDADVNAKSVNGHTALILACLNGYTEIARLLLNKGADINAKHNTNATSLIMACDRNHTEVVKLLLSRNANIDVQDNSGKTAIKIAVTKSNFQIIQLLIEYALKNPLGIIKISDALRTACYFGKSNIVKFLLDKGAMVNTENSDYTLPYNRFTTPLMLAAHANSIEIVQLLLKNGASLDPLHGGYQNQTEFFIWSLKNIRYAEMVNMLRQIKDGHYRKGILQQTPLVWATMVEDLEKIKFILNQNLPIWYINAQDNSGFSALHYAVWLNNENIVIELINYMPNGILLKTKSGETAIELALKNNNDLLANKLMEKLPKLHIPILLKALTLALKNGNQEFIVHWIVKLITNWDSALSKKRKYIE